MPDETQVHDDRGKTDAEAPRLFQLALYALAQRGEAIGAAYCALPEDKPLRGYFKTEACDVLAHWIRGDAARAKRRGCWLYAAAWAAWPARVSRRVRELVAQIRAGRLEAAPVEGAETCKRCDFAQLCRWQADETERGGVGHGKLRP